MAAGHFSQAGVFSQVLEQAERYAFIIWALSACPDGLSGAGSQALVLDLISVFIGMGIILGISGKLSSPPSGLRCAINPLVTQDHDAARMLPLAITLPAHLQGSAFPLLYMHMPCMKCPIPRQLQKTALSSDCLAGKQMRDAPACSSPQPWCCSFATCAPRGQRPPGRCGRSGRSSCDGLSQRRPATATWMRRQTARLFRRTLRRRPRARRIACRSSSPRVLPGRRQPGDSGAQAALHLSVGCGAQQHRQRSIIGGPAAEHRQPSRGARRIAPNVYDRIGQAPDKRQMDTAHVLWRGAWPMHVDARSIPIARSKQPDVLLRILT